MSDPFQEALELNVRKFADQMNVRRAQFISDAAASVVGIGVPSQHTRDALEALIPKIPADLLRDLALTGQPAAPALPPEHPDSKWLPLSERHGEALLGKAVIHRGRPYTWGGDGKTTFDCSSLTQRAAADIGIQIGRTTYLQINAGREIPWGQQQIGDLIFSRFSDTDGVWETPEHVSIWAGNGKVFEAGDPIDYYPWGNRGTVRVRRIV